MIELTRMTKIEQLETVSIITIDGKIIKILKYYGLSKPRENGDYTVLKTNNGSYSKNFLLGEKFYSNSKIDVRLLYKEYNPEYFL